MPDRIPDKKLNLQNAIDYVPELKQAEQSDNPILSDTIRYAKMLEGNVRNTGVHACGTIICRDDITDWVPVATADDKETGEKMLVTQYEGSVIEDTGLLQMDFLGLKTLSIIMDAFNKAHASCYSWVAYQPAYLKANYPSEYMAAVLSRNLTRVDQLTIYMNECKRMGINVMGSDINESMKTFSANEAGDVRFGLAAVKGVGEAAADSIIEERTRNGKFKDIYDFMERVNYAVVNRKCLENLAYAGAFDSIATFHRGKFFGADLRDSSGATFMEQLIRYGLRYQAEKNNAQQSLFGGGGQVDIQPPVIPACADWSQLETLSKEREMMGLYLSAHPLDDYKVIIGHRCKTQLSDLENLDSMRGQEIAVAGMVVGVQNLMTKTGKPWGKFTLEDYNGTHEFALFGKDYENFRKYLFADYFLFVRGKVQPRLYNDKELEFKIISMVQLQELRDTMIKELSVQLPVGDVTRQLVEELTAKVRESKGDTVFRISLFDPANNVSSRFFSKSHKVSLSSSLINYLDENNIRYSIS